MVIIVVFMVEYFLVVKDVLVVGCDVLVEKFIVVDLVEVEELLNEVEVWGRIF